MTEAEIQQIEVKKAKEELSRTYRRMAMTDDGKIILKDLSGFCHANTTCFCEQSPNPYQTAHESGKRRVWLRINSMIERE